MNSFRIVYLIKYKTQKCQTPYTTRVLALLISKTNFIEIIIFIDFHTFYIVREQNVCKYTNRISLLLHGYLNQFSIMRFI